LEIENIFGDIPLDIEFGFDKGVLYLLQLRELKINLEIPRISHEGLVKILNEVNKFLTSKMNKHPYLYGNSTATRVKSGVHNVRKSAMRIVANTIDNIENFEFQEMLNSDKTIDWGLTASFLIINPLIKGEMITKEKEALERIVKINPFIFSLESVCRLSFDDVKCFEERKWGNNRLLFFGIKEGGKYRKPFVVIIDEMNKVKEVYSNYEGIYRSSE
jgi:hypothetical protein